MSLLNWIPDQAFSYLADAHPLNELLLHQAEQFAGYQQQATNNYSRLMNIPAGHLDSSPESIIESAQAGEWLTFLLKVGRWGHMIPGPLAKPMLNIYGNRNPANISQERLNQISLCLSDSFEMLLHQHSFQLIWERFDELNWTRVIRSKCLHFQARAANIEGPIPVAVDGLMSTQWLWPAFRSAVRNNLEFPWPHPGGIMSNTFESYNRYLSAMNAWATHMNIGINELEVRLFQAFRDDINPIDLFTLNNLD
jgi:hypothetical protein